MPSQGERPQQGQIYCGVCGRVMDPCRGILIRGTVLCRGCTHEWLGRQQALEDIKRM